MYNEDIVGLLIKKKWKNEVKILPPSCKKGETREKKNEAS